MTTPSQSDPMGNSISGSNDLQQSIDQLDATLKNLNTTIQGQSNGNGTQTSSAVSQSFASQGVQFTNGSGIGGGSGAGNNGSGGTSGTNPFSISGLVGSAGGGSGAQALVNVGSSVVNGQFAAGTAQLNDQANINTYGYTQAAFWNVSAGSAISSNFGGGSGVNGTTQNNLATSASDARIGGTMLSQLSGQANYTQAASGMYGRGNAAYQFAATTGMANPGLGMQNSASVAGAFYNASTSYNLMTMGIGTTPLQLGTGKQQSMTGVEASIGQRFGFQGYNSATGTFNSQNLSANLDNPLFQMQMMDATGMSQSQYNTWSQQWAQENTAAVGSKTTMNQMQNMVSQYMNGGKGGVNTQGSQAQAQQWLSTHGMSQSLLQSMTQSQAGQTSAEAGGNAAFTQGLQAATTAINNLTAILSSGLQNMDKLSGGAGAVGSLNSTGVIGAGAGGISSTITNAIASGNNLLSDLSALTGVNLSGYSGASTSSGGGGSDGAPSGSVTKYGSTVKSVMKMLGIPSGDYNNIMNQMMSESSGNVDAVNHTDSNAAAGHPSTGLMQVIQGTFDEYAGPYKNTGPFMNGVSVDPTANIYAGLNYAIHRYGMNNLTNVLGHGKGYAEGTTSAKSGLALVGERGPEVVALSGGQQIINASQTAKMMQPSFAGGIGGGGGSGMSIIFQSGAINITTSGGNITSGYSTSSDVQATAAQLVQAVETGLNKSATIRNIASGVTG